MPTAASPHDAPHNLCSDTDANRCGDPVQPDRKADPQSVDAAHLRLREAFPGSRPVTRGRAPATRPDATPIWAGSPGEPSVIGPDDARG